MPSSHLVRDQQPAFGLMLDLYHLTMAYGFWKRDLYRHQAVFNLFFRNTPFQMPYAVVAGLQLAIDILKNFRFSVEDVRYLGQLKGSGGKPLFDIGFLNYLQRLQFRCDVDAVPEGTPAFPNEPLIRVRGPLIEAQLVESALVNVLDFSTLIATKSARMVQVAYGEEIVEFGLRRAQGPDGALTASRAAYIGGCHGTSNVMAAKYYDLPVKGTLSHSWIMVFDEELAAFREYANALPDNCIFLVDTYNTIEGVKNAITVGKELRENGHALLGIRLDSGDLAALSIEARHLLDQAGFKDAIILGGNDIDEHKIDGLHKQGSRIDSWGIGTRLVTGHDKTALGGVYKLAAIRQENAEWRYRMKWSPEKIKTSNPGIQQVKRLTDKDGIPVADMIYDEILPYSQVLYAIEDDREYRFEELEGKELLVPVFREGNLVYHSPDIHEIREHSLQQQALFQKADLSHYRIGLEKHLHQKKEELLQGLQKEKLKIEADQ